MVEIKTKMTIEEFLKIIEENCGEMEFLYKGEHYLVGAYYVKKEKRFRRKWCKKYFVYPPEESGREPQRFYSIDDFLNARVGKLKLIDIIENIEVLNVF